ncbi:hypothetical protein [Bradyrhizobium genosp. P]|uniref:hypothetical protein n=1 Tax=Bradyrhizobium genosp. P TaxID=83641 RepID=UPI003CE837D4
MKSLDVQDLLEYSRAAVAVLRTLQIKDATMSYSDFARAIGLIESPEEKWQPWHRQQTEAILKATAAIEQKAGKKLMKLEYKRIVNKITGRSGGGISKQSAIVTT